MHLNCIIINYKPEKKMPLPTFAERLREIVSLNSISSGLIHRFPCGNIFSDFII